MTAVCVARNAAGDGMCIDSTDQYQLCGWNSKTGEGRAGQNGTLWERSMRWDRDYVKEAADSGKVIPGFNIFGYEDALAVTHAAGESRVSGAPDGEQRSGGCDGCRMLGKAAFLNCTARCSTHWRTSGPLFRYRYHQTMQLTADLVRSCMTVQNFRLKNREITQQMAEYAHARGALLEAELGQVPYSDPGRDGYPVHVAGGSCQKDVI